MKNLDIEKLERKNIYKVPDEHFLQMQDQVFAKIAPKKQAKIFKLNWAYSAAAAVALIFGITFFVNQNDTEKNSSPFENTVANRETVAVTNSLSVNEPQNEVVVLEENSHPDLTLDVDRNQKETIAQTVVVKSENKNEVINKKEVIQNPEIQVDQILANFTSAELADLGKNTEQDIYLDLYN